MAANGITRRQRPAIQPAYYSLPDPLSHELPATNAIITALSLMPHIEGGYFAETDRDPAIVPSPFPESAASEQTLLLAGPQRPGFLPGFRNASTSIFYLLTPASPQGNFHRNRARTVHTLHRGRGRYVLIHEDGQIETFVVGSDVAKGEKMQWIVEGGVWKASFLLPDEEGEQEGEKLSGSGGLLISETVVPGFEYCDHEFLNAEAFQRIVDEEATAELSWLVRKG